MRIENLSLAIEAGRETVLKIAKLGVRDYIKKPFDNETIKPKMHPIAWVSLGVGYGLWLGWELHDRKKN